LLLPFAAAAQDDVFVIDQLNVGLTNIGPEVDRDTPQAALESFIDLTRVGDLDAAAHILNLNDIPVQAQAQAGPLLAQQLAIVIDRKIVIDWQDLLERPDAMITTGDGPIVGKPQKSVLIGLLEKDDRIVLQLPISLRCWCFSDTSAFDKVSKAGEAAP